MSTSTPGQPAFPAKSSPTAPTRGRENAAQDDQESTPERTSVHITARSVVVVTPDYTRIENTERGVTEYGDPLPDRTRQALEVVSFYG